MWDDCAILEWPEMSKFRAVYSGKRARCYTIHDDAWYWRNHRRLRPNNIMRRKLARLQRA